MIDTTEKQKSEETKDAATEYVEEEKKTTTEKPNQLFLVRKVPKSALKNENSAQMKREEYEALVERMLAMQLKEAE